MAVHARWRTGISTDGDLGIAIHLPERMAGVTLRIWEMASYPSARGRGARAGADAVELLTVEGDIVPGPARPRGDDWRRLVVRAVTKPTARPEALALTLRLTRDLDPIPFAIPHEADELAARFHELTFSVDHGGSEVFRTGAPCLVKPRSVWPRALEERGGAAEADGRFVRAAAGVPLAHHHLAIGRDDGDRLFVLGTGFLDAEGALLDGPDGLPLLLRPGRALMAYAHRARLDLPPGRSRIPIALCFPLADDGTVIVERFDVGESMPLSLLGQANAPLGEGAPRSTRPREVPLWQTLADWAAKAVRR